MTRKSKKAVKATVAAKKKERPLLRPGEGRLEPDVVYRPKQVEFFTGLKSTQLYDMIASGEFPKPFRIRENGSAVGWRGATIIEWQRKREATAEAA